MTKVKRAGGVKSQLAQLNNAISSIEGTQDLDANYRRISDAVVNALGYQDAIVFLLDENGEFFKGTPFASPDGKSLIRKLEQLTQQQLSNIRIPARSDCSEAVGMFLDGRIVLEENLADIALPPLDRMTCLMIQKLMRARLFIGIPFVAGEQIIGGVLTYSRDEEEITPGELDRLIFLGNQAGMAIRNAYLTAKLNAKIKSLEESAGELRRLKAYHHEVVQRAQVGILRIDREGRIISGNPKMAELIGVPRGRDISTIGWRITDVPSVINAAESAGIDIAHVQDFEVLSHNLPTERFRLSVPFTSLQGKVFQTIVSIVPLIGEDKAFEGFLLLVEDTSGQKMAEVALQHRMELEGLMASLTSRFVDRYPGELDVDVYAALKDVGEFVDVDRSYVLLLSDDGSEITKTLEWCASGVKGRSVEDVRDTIEILPWCLDRYNRFGIVHIPRVSYLAADADEEKQLLQERGIKSLISAPLVSGDRLLGFIGFDSLRSEKLWQEEDLTLVKIMGLIFSNAFECKAAGEREEKMKQEINVCGRLASIGELASGVAHEINNPLTAIIGFSELLLSKDISEDVKHDLGIIDENAQRVAKIVRNLLTFSRQSRVGRGDVDINLVLYRVLELCTHNMIGSNIEVSTDFEADVPKTVADVGQLQQVFLNIFVNAEQAMAELHRGGKLRIVTERVADVIRIRFEDDGPGISQENMDKIFDPFFTTKDVNVGTGLGLSISREIISQHAGRMFAENNSGGGATLVIELPIISTIQRLEPDEPLEEVVEAVSKERILVVDDEVGVCQLVERVLTGEGYWVECVNSADSALRELREKRYGIVLVDVRMPGMDGIDLYYEIMEIDPLMEGRVVFVTGDTMTPRTKNFLNETKVRYISKPFNIESLKREVKQIIFAKL